MSDVLSVWQLLKLANKSQLSLPLRHQWFVETGRDPYIGLRACAVHAVLVWLCAAVFSVGAADFCAALALESHSSLRNALLLFWLGCIFVFVTLLVSVLSYGSNTFTIRRQALGFQNKFCLLLGALGGSCKPMKPRDIAWQGIDDLKKTAKARLLNAAVNLLRFKAIQPDQDIDRSHTEKLDELEKEFESKRHTFESFGLTHGYEFFFKEARRILAENAKGEKTPAAAS